MTLILTVGLPRSGKTTWARSTGYPIVNPDSIRLALHGQRFYADAEPLVWATAKLMVHSLFLAGHEVVILDATNTTRKRRSEWNNSKWEVNFQCFKASALVCKQRADDMQDKDIIPVIERMDAQFEPLLSEEFTRVIGVIE